MSHRLIVRPDNEVFIVTGDPATGYTAVHVEHVESVDAAAIAVLADLAVTASVQPAFDALWAVTQGAAYQLHLDHLLGSIECGKYADFTVLEQSPLDVDPMAIRDIGVWGTVLGGVPQPC